MYTFSRRRTLELLAVEPLHGGASTKGVLVGDRAVALHLARRLVLVQPDLELLLRDPVHVRMRAALTADSGLTTSTKTCKSDESTDQASRMV